MGVKPRRPESITLRSLTKPAAVAIALYPTEANVSVAPAMFDRCDYERYCPRKHPLAGTPHHYCAADERDCPYKLEDFRSAPSVWSKQPARVVRPEVTEWLQSAVAEIAASDGVLGSTAMAWLLDEWTAHAKLKPKRRAPMQWRMDCQDQLYRAISELAKERRPWKEGGV